VRAIQVERFGGPEVMRVADLEQPVPGPGEVLVRVRAAGINPVDWKVRSGSSGDWFGKPPYVPGWDLAGVVEATGPGVTTLAAGDEVFGMPRFPKLAGCYAEYVAAPADQLAAKPPALDWAQAGGLPLAGLTALQVLDLAGVNGGQRVLMHAAAGGVGHLLVQLARARGAQVIGTARADKHPFLRGLGADETIDYTAGPFEEAVKDVDVVVDPIGGETSLRSLRVLRPGGILVLIVGGSSEQQIAAAKEAGVRFQRHLVHPDGPRLARLADLAGRGEVRVEVAQVLPLDQAARAHQIGETGRTQGKLVLSVAS
jgi:NADPH:quinone reductase-like Zn-dependent oxidoreductase